MDLSIWALVFLCFFVFLAGFIDSAAGGGGLISLPAYLFVGLPPHIAIGCNKFSAGCGTTFSAARFFKNGAVNWQIAAISAVFIFFSGHKTCIENQSRNAENGLSHCPSDYRRDAVVQKKLRIGKSI